VSEQDDAWIPFHVATEIPERARTGRKVANRQKFSALAQIANTASNAITPTMPATTGFVAA
jgi:hypothetical protein